MLEPLLYWPGVEPRRLQRLAVHCWLHKLAPSRMTPSRDQCLNALGKLGERHERGAFWVAWLEPPWVHQAGSPNPKRGQELVGERLLVLSLAMLGATLRTPGEPYTLQYGLL